MKNLLGVLPLVLGLALTACGSEPPAPDYPSPEAGKLPGQETEGGAVDLDALAADDDREMAEQDGEASGPADASPEAESQADDADDADDTTTE